MGPQKALHLVGTFLAQPNKPLTVERVAEVLPRQRQDPFPRLEVAEEALDLFDWNPLSVAIQKLEFHLRRERLVNNSDEPARRGLVVPNYETRS